MVDAAAVDAVIDEILSWNPAFQDPRRDCLAMPGEGAALGQSGRCIPQYPEAGLCVPGSQEAPCDLLLVIGYGAVMPADAQGYVGGEGQGYYFAVVQSEMFFNTFLPDLSSPVIFSDDTRPAQAFLAAIPFSSTYYDRLAQRGFTPLGEITLPKTPVREVVDADLTNQVIDELLAWDPKYEDPRVSCADVAGSGLVLGESGMCIPQFPQKGFCAADSQAAPCDLLLVAAYRAAVPPGVKGYIGGRDAGYYFIWVQKDWFLNEEYPASGEPVLFASESTPKTAYVAAIPLSSASYYELNSFGFVALGDPIEPPDLPVRVVVDAALANALLDEILSWNADFSDPRVSCETYSGDGLVLGDSGVCLPRWPEAGFCVADSEEAPCDYLLAAANGWMGGGPDNKGFISGPGDGYYFEFGEAEMMRRDYLSRDTAPIVYVYWPRPVWDYMAAIPLSSSYLDELKSMELDHMAPITAP